MQYFFDALFFSLYTPPGIYNYRQLGRCGHHNRDASDPSGRRRGNPRRAEQETSDSASPSPEPQRSWRRRTPGAQRNTSVIESNQVKSYNLTRI